MNKNKWFLNGGRESGRSFRLLCETYENKIADLKEEIDKIAFARGELEKENAELKTFRQDCVKLTEDNVVMARQRAETARQLTKAKELLKKYVIWCGTATPIKSPLQIEAEQFLNEVEKCGQ